MSHDREITRPPKPLASMTDRPGAGDWPAQVTEAAVDAAAKVLGYPREMTAGARATVRHALEAAAAAEVNGPWGLPAKPGGVVLARQVNDETYDPPVPVVRMLANEADEPWVVPTDGYYKWAADVDIIDWVPARIVPDDGDGPVQVLRRAAEMLRNRPSTGDLRVVLARIRVCLERLDGAP